jgi:hypothetical protein
MTEIDRSQLPPTSDTYAGLAAARAGAPEVPPAELSSDRAEEWLWGYHAWGVWSIMAKEPAK